MVAKTLTQITSLFTWRLGAVAITPTRDYSSYFDIGWPNAHEHSSDLGETNEEIDHIQRGVFSYYRSAGSAAGSPSEQIFLLLPPLRRSSAN